MFPNGFQRLPYSDAHSKSLWKHISNLSNSMDSGVQHLWAPGTWCCYSDAPHQTLWKTFTKPITFDHFQCPWSAGPSGLRFLLFWCLHQISLKPYLQPIKFNGIWCLAPLSSWDIIFLFWGSPSNSLENLSKTYHIWWFPVLMPPSLSRPRLLWVLFRGLS